MIFLGLVLITIWTILVLNENLRTFLPSIKIRKRLLRYDIVVLRNKLIRPFDNLLLGRKCKGLGTRIGSRPSIKVHVGVNLVFGIRRELIKQHIKTRSFLEMGAVTFIVASLVLSDGCSDCDEIVILIALVAQLSDLDNGWQSSW